MPNMPLIAFPPHVIDRMMIRIIRPRTMGSDRPADSLVGPFDLSIFGSGYTLQNSDAENRRNRQAVSAYFVGYPLEISDLF